MKNNKYYCTKCEHHHYYGKVFKDHKKYKRENNIPSDHFFSLNNSEYNKLRQNNLAFRQILRLFKKYTDSTRKRIYVREINKIIENEI